MAVTAGRDCLYNPKGRMRVSVYKELGIDYSTRTKGLKLVIRAVLYLVTVTYATISLALKTWDFGQNGVILIV